MLLSISKPNFRWVCSCRERGPVAADYAAAKALYDLHRARHLERIQ